jgi:quercetin dioxygenase-like cupin family protein
MVYVLKGWAKMEFEGQGEITVREGSAWIQPPGIKHTVLGFSDDYEILEMIIPAQYDTFNL